MKLNTRLHGFSDYLIGGLLLLPYITDYNFRNPEAFVFASVGILLIAYSILTDYEFGLIKWIPMRTHLALDILSGVFLLFSPWILDMYSYYRLWPELIGAAMILLVVFSSGKAYVVTRRDLDITRPGS